MLFIGLLFLVAGTAQLLAEILAREKSADWNLDFVLRRVGIPGWMPATLRVATALLAILGGGAMVAAAMLD